MRAAGAAKPAVAEERHGANSPPAVKHLDRAPRLRRIAALIDERADESANPSKARALACAMRLRASELEAGVAITGDAETLALIAEMQDEG